MTVPEKAPRRPPRQTVGKGPILGSAFIHTVAIFLAWGTSAATSQGPDFIAFEIELISPPAAELLWSTSKDEPFPGSTHWTDEMNSSQSNRRPIVPSS